VNKKQYWSPLGMPENLNCIFLVLAFMLWTSCNNVSKNELGTQEKKQEVISIEANNNSSTQKKNGLEHLQETLSKFPAWLEEAKPDQLDSKIISFQELNDSLSYAIFENSSGCITQNLETFLNEKKIDDLEIQEICDHDQNASVQKWKEYRLSNSNSIELLKCYKYSDSSKTKKNKSAKSTLDFLEVTAKIDTIVTFHQIKSNGSISISIRN